MKTSLTHLPEFKRQQILQIKDIITNVVNPEKVILFGSYATGAWVEDEYLEAGTLYTYVSDYDFLIVTINNGEKEHVLNDKIINLSRNLTEVPVNCLIHDINYINEGLAFGQYFFADIVKEGVLLYDSGKVEFSKPKERTKQEQRDVATNYFSLWFERGSDFLIIANDCLIRKRLKVGVFQLHQATECFYNTILLVFSGYKPKTHSLEKLRQYAKPYSKELMQIFPESPEDKNESHLFDLLKRGYIDARYKNDYLILDKELVTLIEKVKKMQTVVERICNERINNLV